MKYALLVALREYIESTKAKGFWIGILIMPVILTLSIEAPILLEEKATPVRCYVLVDQSGVFAPAIEASMEKSWRNRVNEALREYEAKYASPSTNVSPPSLKDSGSTDSVDEQTGKEAYLKLLRPRLKTGAPQFKDPRRFFQRVNLPEGINPGASLDTIAQALRPYLRGDRKIQSGGQSLDLAAAILIPTDIESHIIRPAPSHRDKTSAPSTKQDESDPAGNWTGTLETGQGNLRLVFKINRESDVGWSARLDSLDQGAFDIPVDSVKISRTSIRLELRSIMGTYEGTLNKTGSELKGRWSQGSLTFPLDLQKSETQPAATVAMEPESRSTNHISGHTNNFSRIQYWTINASETKLRDDIELAINTEIRRKEYQARGLDAKAVAAVEQTRAPISTLDPKKEKGKEAVNTTDIIRQWAPSGFVYLLWIAIFAITQMLLQSTIEEKSNRIIEVLLSSVTPGELMLGKLFGIAAVGLTMVGAWMVFLFGILSWKGGGASMISGQILGVLKGSNLVLLFAIYFLLGYLMFSSFIISIGSVCNTLKEAQSYMAVITLLMMVPLLTMTYIPRDPNGTIARVLSWIPIYTPFTMMNRAAAGPPLVDLIGTLLLLVASTCLALWMSGKIFRIGILRTGQPPRVIEMIRWVAKGG